MPTMELDEAKARELEEKFDPEMRFRPLAPLAARLVGALLVVLSLFHYYTAGFGLLPETIAPRHPSLLRARAHLPRLPDRQARLRAAGAAGPACAARHLAAGLGRSPSPPWWRSCYVPLIPLDDLAFRVGNPTPTRRDPRRRAGLRAARGDPPLRRLAAADHRARCSWSTPCSGRRCPASWSHPGATLAAACRPSLPDEPGHLRHRARRRRDLRLPLRAVRRASRPASASASSSSTCAAWVAGRYAGGPAKVVDLRLGPVRHDLRLVGRQHRDGRLADHPGDDPPRLQAAFRGGGRSRPPRPAGRSRRRSWARRRS